MQELIETSLNFYYEGFTGRKIGYRLPVDFDNFVLRSIDEFGVDQYMEKIFRATDQQEKSDDEFYEFLLERGFTEANINDLSKDLGNITIMTGPHSGRI